MSNQLEKLAQALQNKENLISGGIGLALGVFGGIVFKTKFKTLFGKLGLLGKGNFGSINSAKAGARTQQELKRGEHPYQLYSMGTPNGQKVTIFMEEAGLPYDAWLISIMKGDQFTSGFVEINPNSKIPALVDYSQDKENGVRVFESGSILLHLAEQTGKFIPQDPKLKTECLNLLFFQMGAGPYIGQLGHFSKYAPKGIWFDHSYAYERYKLETQRICSVLDQLLEKRTYLVGEEYTIADMAWYPWIKCIDYGYNLWQTLEMDSYKNINRWIKLLEQREAVQRGNKINQPWNGNNDHHSQLQSKL
ncbi:Thioredoxin-like fold [Pseudocohnilembus persalinus]|uniref:Thioredoxin-like fold n=1 Tax=Pseudocohnilembus persalinus TaxID=266149 RepID=A0A0V0QWI4_PSEPJ|nr:Thioredoxin-like fold [Pseudocohnilembus persalinus]|eukprot:KRX06761.1 Thioredoxin-like fold [Pseudocohnilembus persalinus]